MFLPPPFDRAALHERAEVLRSVIQYDELRDEDTGCVFYCDNRKWPAGRRLKRQGILFECVRVYSMLSNLRCSILFDFVRFCSI